MGDRESVERDTGMGRLLNRLNRRCFLLFGSSFGRGTLQFGFHWFGMETQLSNGFNSSFP